MSRHFDAASGLPLDERAGHALTAAFEHGWADPARLYHEGRLARQLLDAARAAVATCVGALPQEVMFTGSGSQALQLGLLGLARARQGVGRQVVASAVEHSAVLRAADWVLAGDDPTLAAVNLHAEVEVQAFATALRSPGVALAAVQQVNHEVGAIQPLAEVHALAREAGVPLLVDACAALGSVPVTEHWDVLAGSAHKWGGPAGVGVLVVRSGVRWRSPMPTDEAGRIAGFPNIPGAVAAAAALEHATAQLPATTQRRAQLLDLLRAEVPRVAGDIIALGRPGSAPHIVCFTVLYADGEALVSALDRAGFAVSSGSACTSDTRRPSHVLAAMGAITHGNLRVSLPPEVTATDVQDFLAALPAAVATARDAAGRA